MGGVVATDARPRIYDSLCKLNSGTMVEVDQKAVLSMIRTILDHFSTDVS